MQDEFNNLTVTNYNLSDTKTWTPKTQNPNTNP